MPFSNLYSERTSLRTLVVALLTFIVGIALLIASENWQQIKAIAPVQAVVQDLGALLVSTVTIATLWELAAKRAFLAELMAQAKLAEKVRAAGIVTLTTDFQREVDWKQMFKTVKKLDIFFAYGRTWRKSNLKELDDIAQRPGIRIRVVLPDPHNSELMKELGRRFRTNPEDVKNRILETSNDFQSRFKNVDFSLWFLPESPVFSFYRFDHLIVLALSKHGKQGGNIPTFIVEEGGTIYNFVREEFDAFIQEPDGIATKFFTTKK